MAPFDGFSRRDFLALTMAAGALPLLNACVPGSPSAGPGSAGKTSSQAAAKALFPSYAPIANGPKADFHEDNPLYTDAFDNYPANPAKANPTTPPGSGATLSVLSAAYFPSPTPLELNPTWQRVNKELNAEVKMNVIPSSDYRLKFPTIMAGDDLPDIMHIFFGYTLAPNLPAFFKSKCADLTPYLSGDAAKEYPNLAAIPTPAWKNSISAIDGALYLIPIHRQMTSIPPYGGNFFKNVDQWDTELGQNYVPKSADDFKRALTAMTRPQENRWGIGGWGGGAQLFGLGCFAQVFHAPNQWKLDASGKLLRDRETEEYKAAVGFMRDLFAAGLYWPDSVTSSGNVRDHFAGKKFAVSPDGQGNSWVDFWQRGQNVNPRTRFGMIDPFSAQADQKPITFLGTGFVSMNALKKASADKIKETLRIMNWLAAPFGSQEDLLLTYGIQDQDYTLDSKGNPKPSQDGTQRAGYVPWRYIAQHPWIFYQAGLDGFAKASHDAEKATLPLGIDDPTNGFYSPTFYGKGVQADQSWQDGVREIILSRAPMSDYDRITKEWATTAGDQIRKEFQDAMAAAAK